MGTFRRLFAVLAVAGMLGACGGDDGGSADAAAESTAAPPGSADTTAAAGTAASPTTAGVGGTVAETSTVPGTTMASTSVPPGNDPTTTIDDGAEGGPPVVSACSLLTSAEIESIFGGPVSEPTDLDTSCEWEVGEGSFGGNVPDVLSLVINGSATGQADTRELLGDQVVEVPEAGDGGLYWTDFATLFFDKDGRDLSLQFLAAEADDPLGGLVALANLVG